ncbi:fibronectin type III domain-containing protein [Pedosphaera parvula]|nr:fibronectin type III domain-containing protein [Pedosphaera parvula]
MKRRWEHWQSICLDAGMLKTFTSFSSQQMYRVLSRGFRLAVFCMLACPSLHASQTVTLAWNKSPDTNVVGYNVHYGTQSGNYQQMISAGTNKTVKVTGLTDGLTNYFVVTAYNKQNVESTPSNEISFIAPGRLFIAPKAKPSATSTIISFPAASGHYYEIYASENMNSWTNVYKSPVATTNSFLHFTNSLIYQHRFYKLVLH